MVEKEYKFDIPVNFHEKKWIEDIKNSIDNIKNVEFLGKSKYYDVYYDTKDHLLLLSSLSCRVRFSDKVKLEIKFEPKGKEDLYFTREEWTLSEKERKKTGKVKFEKKKIRDFFIKNFQCDISSHFFPFVEIYNIREKYLVNYKKIKCELSFDHSKGRIVNGFCLKKCSNIFTFCEIEIEMLDFKESSEEDFAELGKIIMNKFSLNSVSINKMQRVLDFFSYDPLKIYRYTLFLNDLPEVCLKKIINYYFKVAIQNKVGCEIGMDIEYVHDMRVALRKMRTTLQCFKDYISRREYLYFKNNCKWIAFFLGKVRDCDVYRMKILHFLPDFMEENRKYEFECILNELDELRDENRHLMKLNFKSKRYRRFILKVEQFCKKSYILKSHKNELLKDFFHETLNKVLRNLRRNIKRVKKYGLSTSDRSIHRLRINFKKLRYTLEIFSGLLDENQKRLRKRLSDIQDALGDYVDTFFIFDLAVLLEEKIGRNRNSIKVLSLLKTILENVTRYKEELKEKILNLLDQFVISSEYISFVESLK